MDVRELIAHLEQLAQVYGEDQRVIILYDTNDKGYRSCSHYNVDVSAPGEIVIECKV